jgi:hypothetical protein
MDEELAKENIKEFVMALNALNASETFFEETAIFARRAFKAFRDESFQPESAFELTKSLMTNFLPSRS